MFDEVERNLIIAIVLIVGALVGGLSYSIYRSSQAEKIELIKTEWECTKNHSELIPIPQTIGNTTVTQFIPIDVCDRYEKK